MPMCMRLFVRSIHTHMRNRNGYNTLPPNLLHHIKYKLQKKNVQESSDERLYPIKNKKQCPLKPWSILNQSNRVNNVNTSFLLSKEAVLYLLLNNHGKQLPCSRHLRTHYVLLCLPQTVSHATTYYCLLWFSTPLCCEIYTVFGGWRTGFPDQT